MMEHGVSQCGSGRRKAVQLWETQVSKLRLAKRTERMEQNGRKFLIIDNKSFDLVRGGRKMEGLRISENGRGFHVSSSLDEEEVAWLLDALEDFYW